jgi:long-chain acyl-CoA synthetase
VIGNPPSLAAFFEVWRRNPGDFLRYESGLGGSSFNSAAARLSYRATAEHACGFAQRLRTAGVAVGDRVVFWGENRPEWVGALWGCLLAGVIVVPLDFRSSPALAARIAAIVDARALLIGEGLAAPTELTCPVWPLRSVVEDAVPPEAFSPADPRQVAEILFTSGATGEPKGVTLTHRNILANLRPIDAGIGKYRRYIRLFSPIRFLNLLPLSHMFGQTMAAFIPPMIAGEVHFEASYNPRQIARLIHRRRISVLVCVPQMLELLRDYILHAVPEAGQPARSTKWYVNWWQFRRVHRHFGLKFWSFVVGAAPLDPALEDFWRKLGFLVIQGYGLTETAPVATLNHPFDSRKGTVGKAISGVEIRIAPDGEVLLRGENVTPGYYGEEVSTTVDADGFLHTGDIGELDAEQRLRILGRKKEMIVSPDGLKVFPEDVERVLNAIPGVRESAVVAKKDGARELVHAVLVLDDGAGADAVVAQANNHVESHQRIRAFSIWLQPALPRTSGTGKLKRVEIAKWVAGTATSPGPTAADSVESIIRKYAGDRVIDASTSLDQLGISSLDRISLLMELEQRTGSAVDEAQFAAARTVGELGRMEPSTSAAPPETFEFPEWNRTAPARWLRRIALPCLILPLLRLFAWIRTEGLENLGGVKGPVIFAANHQSHFDVPSIFCSLPARWRYTVAPAMSKEFFDSHFHPERHKTMERFTSTLNYLLACLVFNTFPLPQREAGAREALRYAGELASDGTSILIFPEGVRTDRGELHTFRPGTAMLAARLQLPVVPVYIEGLHRVLHKSAKFPTPGRARVRFGAPITLEGSDYPALAGKIEAAVRELAAS